MQSVRQSSLAGRLRLSLLAILATFVLLPVAQAAANGTVTVNISGTGQGEVSSVGGHLGFYEGSPPIECTGPPASGTCQTELVEEPAFEPGVEGIGLHEEAAAGSEFVGWTVEEIGRASCRERV